MEEGYDAYWNGMHLGNNPYDEDTEESRSWEDGWRAAHERDHDASEVPAIVKVAQRHKLLTMIDATLATPFNIRPLELGVDIVIHSATKYLGGHNDLLAGVTLGGHKQLEDLNKLQRMIGSIPGPLTCLSSSAD